MEEENRFRSALSTRYASEKMQRLFSDKYKVKLFRTLWIYLAESEKELGLDITQEQIDDLKKHVDDIDLDDIRRREKTTRHDVMANILSYGELAKSAKGIIHLGATSCYVDDNADVLVIRDALNIVREKLVSFMRKLCNFIDKYKDEPILAYTHLQVAQPTTIGKRFSLYLNEFLMDLENLDFQRKRLLPLGCKGATGTQSSFMDLFKGDYKKVKMLDTLISQKMGFEKSVPVSGQTYSRKMDTYICDPLKGLASSAYKFALDLRISSSFLEIQEGILDTQVGSSAMPYKRNPMMSERVCSLSRYVINATDNLDLTSSEQVFERTLDDSANRRLVLPDVFLGTDGILNLLNTIMDRIQVNTEIIERRLMENLPFIALENILMESVKRGADRQETHELLRRHSRVNQERIARGEKNLLLEDVENDEKIPLTKAELEELLDPKKFTGFASKQCDEFAKGVLEKLGEETDVEYEVEV